jgi:hypothetical protein
MVHYFKSRVTVIHSERSGNAMHIARIKARLWDGELYLDMYPGITHKHLAPHRVLIKLSRATLLQQTLR